MLMCTDTITYKSILSDSYIIGMIYIDILSYYFLTMSCISS